MIDLHCHILPGIDDGAPDLDMSLKMARAFVADGVTSVACTPHILPGLYHNTGPQIIAGTNKLQSELDNRDIALRLVPGADAHIAPNLSNGLRSGQVLSLAGSRYVLVEPPHHIAPARLDQIFFDLLVDGYVPILTHPERLTWINSHYGLMQRLAHGGVWMQLTAGSLAGAFGKNAKYWACRMLDEGIVHLLATDAHDDRKRPPNLSLGRDLAAKRVGDAEAEHLVLGRPAGVLENRAPTELPMPAGIAAGTVGGYRTNEISATGTRETPRTNQETAQVIAGAVRGFSERMRGLLK
jgi:protein-tyrosine phosphatase